MKRQLKNAHFYLMLIGDALLFAAALNLAYLFCHVPLIVERPLAKVRLGLDKAFGIISPERLSPR